jgi:hypothetical protein
MGKRRCVSVLTFVMQLCDLICVVKKLFPLFCEWREILWSVCDTGACLSSKKGMPVMFFLHCLLSKT